MFNIFNKKNNQGQNNFNGWGDGRAILGAISDGVIAIDSKGIIRIMNPSAEQMLGWSNSDSSNLSFESVFILVDKDGRVFEGELNPVRRALLSFENFSSRELSLKTQSGKTFPVSIQINPIDDNKSGLVVVFRNITKEIEENRQQTEFISTASHEMRTPVASIEGYLSLALNPATANIDARAREFLNKAYDNTRHLGQLFRDLLDITKSEDGRLKNEPVVLDAVDFTRNIWDGFRKKAFSKGLDFVFDLDVKKTGEKVLTPVYYIHSDRDHLQEVLDNLFENAIKYTPSGKVSVNISGDNENVRISVTDSGIGIPSEDIPHLFQKFYRVDNSETREIGGTGLGLYLSRRLIESMGGKLYLESEYKKGSTFIIQLPRLTREQAEKLKSTEVHAENISKEDKIFESSNEIFESKIENNPLSGSNNEMIEAQPQPQIQTQTQTQTQASSNFEIQNVNSLSGQTQPQQNHINQINQLSQNQITQQNMQVLSSEYQPIIPQSQPLNQTQTIQSYQVQQYYARQKAAEDARVRAEQASLIRARQQVEQAKIQNQNPYFPQNQSQGNFSGVNYSTPAPVQPLSQNTANPAPNIKSQSIPENMTISDIERMREQYIQRMMMERQNISQK